MTSSVKDAAQTSKDAAGAVASTATDAAKDVAHETKQQANDLYAKTKSQLADQVVAQKSSTVDGLRSLGDQLGAMTEDVDESGTAVDLASKARDQVRGAADWLDHREPDQIVEELRRVGREQPGKFLLGAFVAGVVAGRLTRGAVAVHTNGADDVSASPASNPGSRPGPSPFSGAEQGRHVSAPGHDTPAFGLPATDRIGSGYPSDGTPRA